MLFIFKLFLSITLFADSYTEIKDIKVSSDKLEQYDIKQDLNIKAIEKASLQQIKKILGPKKYKAYEGKIKKTIFSQTNKYISSITPINLNVSAPNSTATYSIRLSQDSLMQLLKNNGMFYSTTTKMKVLPLVIYKDQVNFKKYFWWGGNSPFASKTGMKVLKSLHSSLSKDLIGNKFSVIKPIKDKSFKDIPVAQQFLKLSPADVKAVAEKTGANVVIIGDLTIDKSMKKNNTYTVKYNLRTVEVEGMKTLSEVSKSYVSLPGSLNVTINQLLKKSNVDVVAKLNESLKNVWSEGSLGAKTYTITLKGDLKYKQYKSFKKDLITNIGAVNSINEKNFSPGTIVLEVSSPSSLKSVVKRLKKSKFSKYKVNVNQNSKSSLELDIQSW